MANKPTPNTRNVVLEEIDEEIINRNARLLGFGGKGFSAALRFIVRDWAKANDARYVVTDKGRAAIAEQEDK